MSEDVRQQPVTLRSKVLNETARSLSESELLAVLLQTGSRSGSALDLSSRLLDRFGGLRKLLNAERRTLAAEN
ncbi:MAG: hypothetical protein IH912_06900, partial [Proteobacteria bacterium]|nr:hypothetical protein [Pseudomonadota bacterium]